MKQEPCIKQILDETDRHFLKRILGDEGEEILSLPTAVDARVITDWREASDGTTD